MSTRHIHCSDNTPKRYKHVYPEQSWSLGLDWKQWHHNSILSSSNLRHRRRKRDGNKMILSDNNHSTDVYGSEWISFWHRKSSSLKGRNYLRVPFKMERLTFVVKYSQRRFKVADKCALTSCYPRHTSWWKPSSCAQARSHTMYRFKLGITRDTIWTSVFFSELCLIKGRFL